MAALLRDGEAVASWMLDPLSDTLCTAEMGSGAWVNDQRVFADQRDRTPAAELAGAVLQRFLPPNLKEHISIVEGGFASVSAGSRVRYTTTPA